MNAPQCYIIRTLSVLLVFHISNVVPIQNSFKGEYIVSSFIYNFTLEKDWGAAREWGFVGGPGPKSNTVDANSVGDKVHLVMQYGAAVGEGSLNCVGVRMLVESSGFH